MPLKRGMTPHHPGVGLYQDFLEYYELTITDAAKIMEVSRKQLSEVVNGKASISFEMALRIEKVFGGSAEFWLRLQYNYDLWFARKSGKFDHLKPISPKKTKAKAR